MVRWSVLAEKTVLVVEQWRRLELPMNQSCLIWGLSVSRD